MVPRQWGVPGKEAGRNVPATSLAGWVIRSNLGKIFRVELLHLGDEGKAASSLVTPQAGGRKRDADVPS